MIKILGIETSCDETAVAIVREDKVVLSNKVVSQIKEHAVFGGIVPEVASRAHMTYLDQLIDDALNEADVTLNEIDAIAVTAGPGLIGGLIIGVMYAKAMASVLKKPILAINHLEGHALTPRFTSNLEFPFLLLLVSGGHTQFLFVESLGKYNLLGTTLDDAIGEAFDKVAKMLGLGYPGGPVIERRAKDGDPLKYQFPKSMIDSKDCSMSFSGLKTAVLRCVQSHGALSEQDINNICASFQYTVTAILKKKVGIALEQLKLEGKTVNSFVISGGVAANLYICSALREFCEEGNIELFSPPINLCGDNAAMIAWAGIERFKHGHKDNIDFKPRSRWPLEEYCVKSL